MSTACTTDLSRCHLHHDRGSKFHGHSPDDGTAFVAGYVSLIAAHLDNETAAAIRSGSHLVGDDQKALFIVGHICIISRPPEHTRISSGAGPFSTFLILLAHWGRRQTLQGVYPRALASFNDTGILVAAKYHL